MREFVSRAWRAGCKFICLVEVVVSVSLRGSAVARSHQLWLLHVRLTIVR